MMPPRRRALRWLPLLCLLLTACPRTPSATREAPGGRGAPVEVFTESGRVNALIAHGQTLWVGTGHGLVAWDLTRSQARILTVDDGLPGNEILALADGGKDTLWVGTSTGLARFHAGSWSQFGDCPIGHVTAMAAAPDGSTAYAGGPRGLVQLHQEAWKTLFTGSAVTALHYDPKAAALWVGTATQGVLRCQGSRCEHFDAKQLGGAHVTFLAADASGPLVLLGGTSVAYRYRGRWHRYRPDPARPLHWAHFAKGQLILGAGRHAFALRERTERETPPGPLELKPETSGAPEFISRRIQRQLPRHVTVVQQARGALWIGSRRVGVARFDGDLLQYYRTNDLTAGARRLSLLCPPAGGCELATGSRLYRRTGEQWRVQAYAPDAEATIQWIGRDARGALAVLRNGRGGLEVARRVGDKWQPLELQPALQSRRGPLTAVFTRLDPAGRLWVGMALGLGEDQRGVGVAVIDPSSGKLTIHGRGADLPETPGSLGIPSDLTGAAFTAGHTYLGSRQGVIRIDPKGVVRTYSENDGLASELIRDIAVTRDGRLWVATGSGVGSYDGKRWRFADDGGPRAARANALVAAPDGSLWFGTDTGLHRLVGDKVTSWDDGEGLFAREVRSIARDPQGRLWVLHPRGLSIVTPGK